MCLSYLIVINELYQLVNNDRFIFVYYTIRGMHLPTLLILLSHTVIMISLDFLQDHLSPYKLEHFVHNMAYHFYTMSEL